MRIKSLLTIASITFFFLTMPQITGAYGTNQSFSNSANEFARPINKASSEPNQSKTPSVPSNEKAKRGMYNAVMSALSAGSGLETRAREHAEKALLLLESPSTDIEFYAKGIAYRQLGNDDLAIVNFDKAIELNPQRFISYLSRGLAYRHKENYDRAIVDFDKAIELELNMMSGDVEQRKDDSNKRDKNETLEFHELVQANPEPWFYWFLRGEAYHYRGKAYFNKGNYDTAIADFNTFIQLNPNRADAYQDRGAAYGLKGDLDRALADFDRAIQLDPQLKLAHSNRDLVYQLKRDQDRARVNGELPPVRKSEVDQQLEDAAKRGEKVLYICLQDCGSSSGSLAGVEIGKALTVPKPNYPEARLERASGSVEVRVLINEEGKVIAADAISGDPSLRNVCVEAARKALFSPTRRAGNPVKVTGVIRYNVLER